MQKPVAGEILPFKTSDKLMLEGFLVKGKQTKPCIIYVHEWGGNFYRPPALGIVSGLSQRGLAAFSMNTRGHDSATNIEKQVGKKLIKVAGGVSFEKFEESVLDIGGAIKQLQALGFKKFVLLGHSTGCQKIVYYQLCKKDPKVIGLILLSPGDDYWEWKHLILKENFDNMVKKAKKLVARGKGNEMIANNETAQRFLSVADLNNIEARLFHYDGKLEEFSKIKTPMLALYGDKEWQHPNPRRYLKRLEEVTSATFFETKIVKGTTHWYPGCEDAVARHISQFVANL